MKLQNLTYAKIAEALEVSTAAVSLAVTGKPGISEKTRTKILDFIKKHDQDESYTLENRLASNSKHNILFIFYADASEIYAQAHSKILKAAQEEARQHSFTLQPVYQISGQNPFQYIEELEKYPEVAGVLVLATELDAKTVSAYKMLKVPLLVIDSFFDEEVLIDTVELNYQTAFYEATKYAFNFGHEKIGFLTDGSRTQNLQHKLDGFWKALRAIGIQNLNDVPVIHLSNNIDNAYRRMKKSIENRDFEMPTLFIGASDYAVLGAMKAFEEKNIAIPDTVSFIGCGNIEASQVSKPSLTTIESNPTEMGKVAVRNLLRRMNSPNDICTRTQISTKFIKRQSVKILR